MSKKQKKNLQFLKQNRVLNVDFIFRSSFCISKFFKHKKIKLFIIFVLLLLGTDYQLLVASHSQIELDSKTGRIIERTTTSNDFSNNNKFEQRRKSSGSSYKVEDNKIVSNPLISMYLIVKNNVESNYKEYIVKSLFSMLDIVLNPETISELVLLFYSSYLNITSSRKGQRFIEF